MAWNGSKTEDASKNPASAPKRNAAKSPSLSRGLIAGGFVVFIGILALYFITGEKDDPAAAPQKPSVIAEVDPDLAPPETNDVVETEVEVKKVDPNARPTKVGEIVNGYIKLPSGRMHRIKGEVTNDVAVVRKPEWFAVFDHQCDNEIACYLTMEPGETLVGTPIYRGRFKNEFLESLKSPIIVSKDDSPEVQNLKRSVIEAKIDLKEALDRGEDIEKIMLDTRSQLQDMNCYKLALEQDMKEMIRQDATCAQDIDTFIEAANKMLEAKGIAPMKLNEISRKRLERLVQQYNGEVQYE